MKNLLLILSLLSCQLLSAQLFAFPDFTTSLAQAHNCSPDSTFVNGNGLMIERIDYTYDAGRRLLEKYRYSYSLNESEIASYKYDGNDSVVEYRYAAGQGVPTLTAMTRMSRTPTGLRTDDTVYYSAGSQFTPNISSSYIYDGNGDVTEITKQIFTGSWANFNRHQYQYDGAGNLVYELFQGWIGNAWQNSSQRTMSYDVNGNLSDVIFESWNASNSTWNKHSRTRYAFTGTHLDTLTAYSWAGAWTNGSRYVYSPAAAIDSVSLETWDGQQWDGYNRFVRTWGQGKLLSVTEKKYNSAWESVWKHEYIYDAKGNHTGTNFYVYNTPDVPWVLLSYADHYYGCSTVGLSDQEAAQTKTYPVPSRSMLYFDAAQSVQSGKVYDASGTVFIHFQGSSVDLSQAKPGVYFVKLLLADGGTRVVKAIRE